jgi:site-specific DNA recombinase
VAQDVDYTTPEGRMFMGMLATLAQYYSDNLAQETKKGKAERKAQGLYNGLIPFGMMKGSDGTPVADPATIGGLRLAFQLGAEGRSDRAIAQALNAAGYRTTGNRGHNPFTKDTVRVMLRNRFYLGELPGERPADAAPVRHEAVIEPALWQAAQDARERRTIAVRTTIPRAATVYSLSGLGICGRCGSTLHIQPARGRPRIYCSGRRQGRACSARSAALAGYEQQIGAHLSTFTIPADYRERLRAFVAADGQAASDISGQRRRLESQLERLKDLYVLEDITKAQYLAEREKIKRELATLDARATGADTKLAGLAGLLADVAAGWNAATPEQRNRLARLLFEEIVIDDNRVVAVKPRPELAGFFLLDCQTRAAMYRTCGTDGIRTRDLLRDRQAC